MCVCRMLQVHTFQMSTSVMSEASDLKLLCFLQEKLAYLVEKWFPELPLLYPEAGILTYMVSTDCV